MSYLPKVDVVYPTVFSELLRLQENRNIFGRLLKSAKQISLGRYQ
jgi:hypothetical protein